MNIEPLIMWVEEKPEHRHIMVEYGHSKKEVRAWATTFEFGDECLGKILHSFDDITGQLEEQYENKEFEKFKELAKKYGGKS